MALLFVAGHAFHGKVFGFNLVNHLIEVLDGGGHVVGIERE